MTRDDAASWQHRLDDVPEQPDDSAAESDDAFGMDFWDDSFGQAADPAGTNLFSAEIENVHASDWDIDTASIWGDDGHDVVEDGGATGSDFPL